MWQQNRDDVGRADATVTAAVRLQISPLRFTAQLQAPTYFMQYESTILICGKVPTLPASSMQRQ